MHQHCRCIAPATLLPAPRCCLLLCAQPYVAVAAAAAAQSAHGSASGGNSELSRCLPLLAWDEGLLRHCPPGDSSHPERPERAAAVMARLAATGLAGRCRRVRGGAGGRCSSRGNRHAWVRHTACRLEAGAVLPLLAGRVASKQSSFAGSAWCMKMLQFAVATVCRTERCWCRVSHTRLLLLLLPSVGVWPDPLPRRLC